MTANQSKKQLLQRGAAFILSLIFFLVGMLCSVRGPALLDLADYAGGVSLEKFSIVFLICSSGFVIGSLAAGLVFDYGAKYRIYFYIAMMLVACLSCFAVPIFPGSLVAICILFTIQTMTVSALQDGGSILCMEVWPEGAKSCNLCLYFFGFTFYMGCFASPFISLPFLAVRSVIKPANRSQMVNVSKELMEEVTKDVQLVDETRIQYFYFTLGVLFLIILVAFSCFYQCWGRAIFNCDELEKPNQEKDKSSLESTNKSSSNLLCYMGMGLINLIFNGTEITFGAYLTSFCVLGSLQTTPQEGALITSMYFGAQCVSSVCMILIATVLSPVQVTYLSMTVTLAGCVLAFTLGCTYVYALMGAALLFGLGNSSFLFTSFMWLKSYGIPVKGRVVAAMSLLSSLGAELLPAMVGRYMEKNPKFLTWTILVGVGIAYLTILAMTFGIHVHKYGRKKKTIQPLSESTKHVSIIDVKWSARQFDAGIP